MDSSLYRFGKNKIGIGTAKNEVEKTYKGFSRLAEPEYGFIDGTFWVHFDFDENQLVNRIVVTQGP